MVAQAQNLSTIFILPILNSLNYCTTPFKDTHKRSKTLKDSSSSQNLNRFYLTYMK